MLAYLIGVNRGSFCEALFTGIPWSTEAVFAATRLCIREAGLAFTVLDPWPDIDGIEDLEGFYQRNANKAGESRTIDLLKRVRLFERSYPPPPCFSGLRISRLPPQLCGSVSIWKPWWPNSMP